MWSERMTSRDYRRSMGLDDASEFGLDGKPKGKSKFGAKRVVLDGHTFDSGIEAKRYGELKMLELGGKIERLVVHPIYPVLINDIEVFVWTGDFEYWERQSPPDADGFCVVLLRIEDVKSEGTRREREWKLKKRVVEAACGITITEVVR